MKKIFIFSKGLESYPRNKAFLKILERDYNVSLVDISRKKDFFRTIFFANKNDYFLFIFGGKISIFILIFLGIFGKNIVCDFFISKYDSFVFDRKLTNRFSIKSIFYYLEDFIYLFFSKVLIFDTKSDANYFLNKFKVKTSKKTILILNVLIDLDYIEAIKSLNDYDNLALNKKKIIFYGKYIPLQGVEIIVKSAKILEKENIVFFMIGDGQTKKKCVDLSVRLGLKNIFFIDSTSYEKLIGFIKGADICLGIFGGSDKAMRVIPNKILDYMACSKPVVTGKNSELEKFFIDNDSIFYCEMMNEIDLAKKITEIYRNDILLNRVGDKSRKIVEKFDIKLNKINL